MRNIEPKVELMHVYKEFQRNEITEYFIYLNLAKSEKVDTNKAILSQIANEEKAHYEFWKRITKVDVQPKLFKIFFFVWIARILGLTFGI
jgi:rubrerythrin